MGHAEPPRGAQRLQLADAARVASRSGAACAATTTSAVAVLTGAGDRRSAPASTVPKRWATGRPGDIRPRRAGCPGTGGPAASASTPWHLRRPGREHRTEVERPVEAGDRGGQRHGLRRRVLHAGRGRLRHRRRARHLLRPARDVRHDVGFESMHMLQKMPFHEIMRVAAARLQRAAVRQARPRDRPGHRGRARRRAPRRRGAVGRERRRVGAADRDAGDGARRSGRHASCRGRRPSTWAR